MSFFPARGLLVALGNTPWASWWPWGLLQQGLLSRGFSLGLLLLGLLGGFGWLFLGLLGGLGGFLLGWLLLGFLGGLEDPSGGCFGRLGPFVLLPFLPFVFGFSGGTVQDADSGQINEEPPLCPGIPCKVGKGAVGSSVFPKSRKLRGLSHFCHGRAGAGTQAFCQETCCHHHTLAWVAQLLRNRPSPSHLPRKTPHNPLFLHMAPWPVRAHYSVLVMERAKGSLSHPGLKEHQSEGEAVCSSHTK